MVCGLVSFKHILLLRTNLISCDWMDNRGIGEEIIFHSILPLLNIPSITSSICLLSLILLVLTLFIYYLLHPSISLFQFINLALSIFLVYDYVLGKSLLHLSFTSSIHSINPVLVLVFYEFETFFQWISLFLIHFLDPVSYLVLIWYNIHFLFI